MESTSPQLSCCPETRYLCDDFRSTIRWIVSSRRRNLRRGLSRHVSSVLTSRRPRAKRCKLLLQCPPTATVRSASLHSPVTRLIWRRAVMCERRGSAKLTPTLPNCAANIRGIKVPTALETVSNSSKTKG